MPVEVTKKLVSADCACAVGTATAMKAATAGIKHTREIVLARASIVSSGLFLIDRSLSRLGLKSTRRGRDYSGRATPQ
jgi:hypothetical protein